MSARPRRVAPESLPPAPLKPNPLYTTFLNGVLDAINLELQRAKPTENP